MKIQEELTSLWATRLSDSHSGVKQPPCHSFCVVVYLVRGICSVRLVLVNIYYEIFLINYNSASTNYNNEQNFICLVLTTTLL